MEKKPTNALDFEVTDIDAKSVKLSKYGGDKKAILITNVASKCGHTTKHYTEYVELFNEYK
jgi:glutathione peroxidase